MKLEALTNYLDNLLNLIDYAAYDISLNGLQIGKPDSQVKKIAFCVDCSLEAITHAANAKADLLVVHHGLFWGKPIAITANHYNRVAAAINSNLSLYAAHLPLDAHPIYGNNAQIAMALQLTNVEPFGLYHGKKIGFKGILPSEKTVSELLALLGINNSEGLTILPFGKKEISSVAVVSGGAAKEVNQAISEGIDCYITGEASHEVYHSCKESNINLIALGHYYSETFGVKALASHLQKQLGLETIFIDLPTKL